MGEDFPVRVYYEDTDAGGVLYHAAVIRYMDRGRTEWLRNRGYTLAALEREYQRVFAVHSLSARYLLPGRLDDELTVRTQLSGRARLSLDFSQALWREGRVPGRGDYQGSVPEHGHLVARTVASRPLRKV